MTRRDFTSLAHSFYSIKSNDRAARSCDSFNQLAKKLELHNCKLDTNLVSSTNKHVILGHSNDTTVCQNNMFVFTVYILGSSTKFAYNLIFSNKLPIILKYCSLLLDT